MSASSPDSKSRSPSVIRNAAERLRRDLTLAARSLRRAPAFTVASIAILGLGIGMSAAMYTVYRAVLVDRLPVTGQDQLVALNPIDRGGAHLDVPRRYLDDMRRDLPALRGVAGVYHKGTLPTPFIDGTTPIHLGEALVTPNLFQVLGSRPWLGRLLRAEDGAAGAAPVMVISYQAWRREFNSDSLVVGRSLVVPYNQQHIAIVGVVAPGFGYPAGVDAWVSLPPDFVTSQVDIVARLAPGVTLDVARRQFLALLQRVNPFAGEMALSAGTFVAVDARMLTTEILGNARPAIVMLTLAVALLLAIACVNVGNLLLVRNAARTREIAVRRAIGASVGDLVHQLVVESALLAAAGGVVGLISASVLLRLLRAFAPPELPRADLLGVAGSPLGAAAAISAVAVLLFGLAPSLAAARTAPYSVLRSDARAGSDALARRRARRWLVASQMALALVMLAGAALLARSLDRLQRIDLGYRPEHLSVLSFTGPQSLFPNPEQDNVVADQLMARVRALPGVTAVTPIEGPPFKGQSLFIMRMARADATPEERSKSPFIPWEVVGTEYFSAFGISLERGRAFSDADGRNGQHVVIVSEALAHRMWPNVDPIGQGLRDVSDSTNQLWTVVGVARDTHFRSLRDVAPVIYIPSHQAWNGMGWSGIFAVRTTGNLASVLPSMRRAAHDFNPGVMIWKAETMDELLDAPLAQPRLSAFLLSSFSVVALLLAAVGLYAVMSSAVRQQTRDIGVRVALGAAPSDVRRLVLGEAIGVVAVGGAVGLVAALASTRLLSSLLYGVQPGDPVSLAGATMLLLAIGIAAAYVPARRAARIDPARALRAE